MPQHLQLVQRSPEWFAARRGKITASLAGAILGVNPHQGPLSAWREITQGSRQGNGNAYKQWGADQEERARSEYEVETGNLACSSGLWVHRLAPWLAASPDGLIGSEGLLEVKCPMQLPATVPQHHLVQIRVQLTCTERSWCDYFAWAGPHTTWGVRVERDELAELDIIGRLEKWYEKYIVTNTPPPRRRAA